MQRRWQAQALWWRGCGVAVLSDLCNEGDCLGLQGLQLPNETYDGLLERIHVCSCGALHGFPRDALYVLDRVHIVLDSCALADDHGVQPVDVRHF